MVRDLDAALLRAADDLNAAGARWAMFGVLAVPARSIRRSTRDIGFVVAVKDDAASEALVHQLHGYTPREIVEHEYLDRLSTLLTAASEADLALAREAVALIVTRGVHREQDLLTDLEQVITAVR
ncbi:MAG TPA: hypothetical protein PLP55_12105 [Phycicoccus elongatus]|uniref:hypothetical protein n=1 Tax=Phycicoccus elongatus TaxID=101689 RepID=UPI002B8984DD|nr:hypothetical protein [Phycicoccus elongatus]HOA67456.1 hypothetical protein [Phycicoccus elongatus]HPK13410.1 hypothetical protein [Phycicoccus elongatus]HRW03279.1 hypothetical protein [Tetrasphaera sp.]